MNKGKLKHEEDANNGKVRQLIALSLWMANQFKDKEHRDFIYSELLKLVGDNDDYKNFIEENKRDCG